MYGRAVSLSAALGMNRRFGDAALSADDLRRWIPEDPFQDWEREARAAAEFGWILIDTDAYSCGFVNAQLELTHGSSGLRFKSRYQSDDLQATTEEERAIRRILDRWILRASSKFNLDINGQATRLQLETVLSISQHVTGDGFAVRVFSPSRRNAITSNAWRIIDSARVCNPQGVMNWERPKVKDGPQAPEGHTIWEGIELDGDDRPFAIWVKSIRRGCQDHKETWERIEIFADDGTRNVIHRFDPIKPGALRGFSDFAPVYVNAKHLRGVSEAHLVGKRAQACHPLFVTSDDPDVAAAFTRAGATIGPNTRVRPGMIGFLGTEGGLHMPSWSYQGDDFKSFVENEVRAISATKGIPWQYVLKHIEGVSMASGRIVLDWAKSAGEGFQNRHIPQVTAVIDEVILREGIARGLIPSLPLEQAAECNYLRPRSASTDKNREADAALKQLAAGRAPETVHADVFGDDFEANVIATEENLRFMRDHGVSLPEVKIAIGGADDEEETTGDDDERGEQ